jgi:UTP--glucose-1-phosphate uridylyltransferase
VSAQRIREAIVPVAGLGTRLLPATRSAPKEMLPVVDRPVVQYVIEELAEAGIERVLMVTGRRKRAIEDHFDADPELGSEPVPATGMRLYYTRQPRPAGLGDAVARGDGFAAVDAPGVVVALGDAILARADGTATGPAAPSIVARLIAAHETHGADATLAVTEVPEADVSRYGIVSGEPLEGRGVLRVTAMTEKPAPGTVDSRLAVAARYVLGPAVFAALAQVTPDGRGEIQLTDAIAAVIAAGGRVLAVPLAPGERRHDIGSVRGYCETFLHHALTHPELGAALRAQAAALLAGDD